MDPDRDVSAALLRHPPFAFLWSSRLLANVGFHMLGVAVGWQLYALTGSALDLGLVGLVQFAPMILLTLIVGQVADRHDRRLIATVCQIVKAAAAAALALGTLATWQSNTSILAAPTPPSPGHQAPSPARRSPAGAAGTAGSFGFEKEHYDISVSLGDRRLAPAVTSAPADTDVIAPGISCRQQIQHLTGRAAKHPAEALRDALLPGS